MGYFCGNTASALDSLHAKLIKIFKGTDYEFFYKHVSLDHHVQKLGFKYRKCDKRSIIMESMKIAVWWCKYLTVEIAKY